ncbi:MAG: hypothetical protein Kow0099_10570 [Candidatus Abyssubacteria bacterium]
MIVKWIRTSLCTRSEDRPDNQRGIVLISVVMVVFVAAAFVSVAATRTVQDKHSTDTRIENIRSFYAAQAGEHAMKAAIQRDALARFQTFQAAWSGSGPILTNPASFFANQVTLPGVLLPNGACFDTVQADLAFINSEITPIRQVYNFQYTITSIGTSPSAIDRVARVISTGNFQIQVERQSFANYALFTDTHTLTSGTRVWFTSNTNFTGRVHTNGRFAFAFYPTFSNGLVSSVADDAYFYNNGSPRLLEADNNAPNDVPAFGEGFERGADPIALPPNAFDQRAASVGGSAADNEELRTRLGLTPDTSPPPDGIYVPNDGASLTGGVYVQGNVIDVLLYVDSGGRQCYHITHSNGSTSSITVDTANNQTIVNSVTYQGTPNGALYVAGNVNSLGGPNRTGEGDRPPAIQSETALSVFSEGDVVITRDIVYEADPLAMPDAQNVMGIFTPDGDVRIATSAPNDIVIHSTLMTSDEQGVVQVDEYASGGPRGTATILGGVISSYYGAFGTFNSSGHVSGYARNFVYDERLNGGLAPPFFPTTTLFMPANIGMNQVNWTSQRQYVQGFSQGFQMPSSNPDFNPDFS